MIIADNPLEIENTAKALLDASTTSPLCVADQIAALAQTLGFVFEHARMRAEANGVTLAELEELVARYRRVGAAIEFAIYRAETN